MHDEVREVNGVLECFKNGKQLTLGGQQIAGVDPEFPVSKLFEDLYETELGSEFLGLYDTDTINPKTGETNAHVIERVFAKLYPDLRMTMSRAADAIKTAIDAGALARKPEPVVARPPRDERGRFADEQALLRAEVRRMLNDHATPASALRARASKDAAFRMAMEAEMAPTAPTKTNVPEDIENLEDFSERWRKCPNPKPIAGKIKLDEYNEYSVPELNRLLERCAAAGIL